MITFIILLIAAVVLAIGILLFTAVVGGSIIVVFGDAIFCAGIIYAIVLIVKKIQEKRAGS